MSPPRTLSTVLSTHEGQGGVTESQADLGFNADVTTWEL